MKIVIIRVELRSDSHTLVDIHTVFWTITSQHFIDFQ